MKSDRDTLPSLGMERFRLVRRIGEGGMGVVYEAFDREQDRSVALKTLRTVKARELLRLKHEFRALQDLEHSNLVRFGELFESEGNWFFTMELVDGVDFLSYVRTAPIVPATVVVEQTDVDALDDPTRDLSPPRRSGSDPTPLGVDLSRLRRALIQLARGLVALHAASKVHRDIKPSNILVSRKDRVVVLDFGLVSDLIHDQGHDDDEIGGTLAFMAPEQTTEGAVGPAADWYAVGVLLYLALTGHVPLVGPREIVFELKRSVEPKPPRALRPDVPVDLDALCSDLLRIDPSQRPSGPEVLRRLDADRSGEAYDAVASRRAAFVGREAELSVLHQSFQDVRAGQTVIHLVHGESGVGKSTLVRQLTRRLAEEVPDGVVLTGRCHERESVPYKALDEIVDGLSRRLRQFNAVDAAAILPRMASLLTQAFPVLLDVEAFARAPKPLYDVRDPKERRRRVFMELRELLARLGDRRPLVLVIDDLQWSDADSLALLSEIVRPPNAPALLLLATVRETSESGAATPSRFEAWWRSLAAVRHLHLHNLPPQDARQLVGLLIESDTTAGRLDAATIAEESEGHPLFIDALVRHRMAPGTEPGDIRLEEALWTRIGSLASLPRKLLELVAVAGRPLPQAVLARAAGVETAEFMEAVSLLRRVNLVRTEGIRTSDTIEPYHHRVGVAVRAHLEAAHLSRCHERLAFALESLASGDLEALAVHWQAAGQGERGARFAIRAAEQAAEALAFERAARLFRLALEAHPFQADEQRELQTRLANALALAARSVDAAEAFRAAAVGATGAEALELKRRTAEQLLISGHIDEGLAEVKTVLGAAGLTLPATSRRAAISLLLRRARIGLRGLGFRERDASDIAPNALKLIDLTFAISQGLIWVDVIRGAEFQTRHVLLALQAGEPFRLSRALAIEAGFAATSGGRGPRRAARLLDTAQKLADKGGNPHALGFVLASRGFAAVAQGQWLEARDFNEKAETIFAERCSGVPWELALTRTNMLWALSQMGQLRELTTRGFNYMNTALGRGDLFARASMICGPLSLAYLGRDDPDRAHGEIDEAMAQWSQKDFHLQHEYALVARCEADLYAGDPQAAYRRLVETWPALRASYLPHFQITRIQSNSIRARSAMALALACRGAEQKRLLDEVGRLARRLDRERLPFAQAIAVSLRGGEAFARGRSELADRLLDEAAQKFDASAMSLYAAATRRRRGLSMGGDRGRELVALADRQMVDLGVTDPARMAGVYAPGGA